ncbi:MAG: tRNA (adenosine(37)-N6)-dimethylallyltransferase MiaA [Chitinispirillaceae bacterium]|nr:tRNA (adenosine(37)-N6)-dimethylallyltransferase MiaA [Chitinispirillaceae bacterium]
MTPCLRIKVPVLLGPTASGKTAVALRLAESAGWEIISCDSRQVYRYMDIGTAKPRREELGRVRHRLIDILDPQEPYSAAAFANDALNIIRTLAAEGKTALVCGGTGLYFESLRRGIGPQVASDPLIRDTLARRAAEEGCAALHRELHDRDPEAADAIHANNVQRVVRALAVWYQTGKTISELKRLAVPPEDIEFTAAVLMPRRDSLYERINGRVDEMTRRGLWEEFVALRGRGYDERTPGLRCVGYRELFAVERGTASMREAVEMIKRNSRRYAKRQITWFRMHNRESMMEYAWDTAHLKKIERALAISGH